MTRKPSEIIKAYREALVSMEAEPEEWLKLLKPRLATCKDKDGSFMWKLAIKRCNYTIERRNKR